MAGTLCYIYRCYPGCNKRVDHTDPAVSALAVNKPMVAPADASLYRKRDKQHRLHRPL